MDITALGLSVDSRTVVTADQALEKMAVSGAKAETAVTALEQSAKRTGPALGAAAAAAGAVKTSATGLAGAQTAVNRSVGDTVVSVKRATDELRKLEMAEAAAALTAARSAQAQAALAQATQRNATAQAFLAASTQRGSGTPTPEARGGAEAAQTALAAATAKANIAQQRAAQSAAAYQRQLVGVGKTAGLSAMQVQQLGFQVNDFLVQIASGGNPLTAFIQQGSQLSGTFGGARPAFQAVMSLLTPMRLLLGGVAAAAAGLGVAWAKGNQESADFAKALALTGNFAGQTEGAFKSLTREVSASSGQTVSAVREIASALLATGEIGPTAFRSATEAAVGYAAATGKTAEEVQKDFTAMARGPTKFALEANRQLNFLTAAQYQAIKGFEDTGRTAQAQLAVLDALNVRFGRTDQNLGTIERTLRSVKGAWAAFWDAAFDIGRSETIEDKIASTERALDRARGVRTVGRGVLVSQDDKKVDQLQEQQQQNLRRAFRETENAFAQASLAEVEKAGIAADAVVESYVKRAKGAEGYKRKLEELNAAFKAREAAGIPVSPAEKSSALEQLRKDFTDTSGAASAAAARKAQLDADLRFVEDVQAQQVAAYGRANGLIDAALQARLITEADYFDAKRTLIEGESDAQERALIDQQARIEVERARLEASKGNAKEIIDLRRQEAEIEARLQEVRADAASKVEILGIQAKAATDAQKRSVDDLRVSYEQYLDAVRRANSLEAGLVGRGDRAANEARARLQIEERFRQDEEQLRRRQRGGQVTQAQFDEELAIIRAAKQAELAEFQRANGAILSEQSDWANGMSRALENYLDEVRNTAAETDRVFSNAFRSAEDALTEFFNTGRLDARSFLQSILGDVNRNIARQIVGSAAEEIQRGITSGDGIGGALRGALGGILGGGGLTVPGFAGGQIAVGAGAAGGAAAAAAQTAQATALASSTAAIAAQTAAVTADTAATGASTAATTAQTAAESAATAASTARAAADTSTAAATAALAAAETTAAAAIAAASATSAAALTAMTAAATAAAAALSTVGASSALSSASSGFSLSGLFMAGGGRPPVGQATVVGENGIELFVPDQPGRIMSTDQTRAALSAGGSSSSNVNHVEVHQHFSGNPTRDTLEQAAASAGREVQVAITRGTAGFERTH
jgi:lambda family phage tail tape measure protein